MKTAEQLFFESVNEVAQERLSQFMPALKGTGTAAGNPGAFAREIVRARGCIGPLSTMTFNRLRSSYPLVAATIAVEVEAFPAFVSLVRDSQVEPAKAERLEQAYMALTLSGIEKDSIEQREVRNYLEEALPNREPQLREAVATANEFTL